MLLEAVVPQEKVDNSTSTLLKSVIPQRIQDKKSKVSDEAKLPCELERINRIFGSLCAVTQFLEKHHISSTWETVRDALWKLNSTEKITSTDILNISEIAR